VVGRSALGAAPSNRSERAGLSRTRPIFDGLRDPWLSDLSPLRTSTLLTTFLALVVGIVAVWLVVGGTLPAGLTATALSRLSGSNVALERARVVLGWPPEVVVVGGSIGAPDWARADHLMRVERASVTLRPRGLWDDRPWLRTIRLERPRVHLELHSRHGPSWHVGRSGTQPSERVAVEALTIRDGRVTFRHSSRGLTLALRELRADGRPPAADAPVLEAQGELNGDPARLVVHAERRDDGYRLDVTAEIGRTTATAHADLARPWLGDAFAVDLTIEAPSLADLPRALPGEFPETGRVRLGGRLARSDAGWQLSDLAARVGATRWRGQLAYRPGDPRGRLAGELRADPLDLRAGPSGGARADWPSRVAARLGLVGADLALRVDRFAGTSLPLERLDAHILAEADRLRIQQLQLATAGGRVEGDIELRQGRDGRPSLDVAAVMTEIQLARWLRPATAAETLTGTLSGEANLAATGGTMKAMAANAAGALEVTLADGTVRRSMVELIGLDVSNALLLPLTDRDMAVRCGVVRGSLAAGRLSLERAALDTPSSILIGRGAIDLSERELDLRIETRAKDFSLFDAAAPVRVRGPIADPDIVVGSIDGLPFLELGDARPLDCEAIAG